MPHRVLIGFIKRELKNVQDYLEQENVDLDAFDINGDLLKIKLHKVVGYQNYFSQMKFSILMSWIIITF